MYTELTHSQKLAALSHKFYQGAEWVPAVGDYYTTARNDMQLYQIVREDDVYFYTSYLPLGCELSAWHKEGFTDKGFGPKRVHVPMFIFQHY